MKKEIVYQAENLLIGYSKSNGLTGLINFELSRGQVLAITGPNGVGKSTLAQTLIGLQPKLEGKIEILGRNLDEFGPRELSRSISTFFTDRPKVSFMTVRDLIQFQRPKTNPWEKELLSILQLEKFLGQTLTHLSDGQLQLAYLARAMVQDVPILLLDEPTTYLDLFFRQALGRAINFLASNLNRSIILTTHDWGILTQVAHLSLGLGKESSQFDLVENHIMDGLFDGEDVKYDYLTNSWKYQGEGGDDFSFIKLDQSKLWGVNSLLQSFFGKRRDKLDRIRSAGLEITVSLDGELDASGKAMTFYFNRKDLGPIQGLKSFLVWSDQF